MAELRTLLGLLDTPTFGSDQPPIEDGGDDRRGGSWLVIDERVRLAVKMALITYRPLLVTGPSGSGKSALAHAVARTLGWTYYEMVVTSQTRLEELTGWVDLIHRLNEAEVAARLERDFPTGIDEFLRPGVLWWALDPSSARAAGRGDHVDPGEDPRHRAGGAAGAVVLIDEIDKAEPDLPNNLLVPLGSWELRVEGRARPVTLARPNRPLVIITSNQERDMPAAFLRRCLGIELAYPTAAQLVDIAVTHLGEARRAAAELVRRNLVGQPDHRVSPAEFVDAVRAADGLRQSGLDLGSTQWRDIERIVLGREPERRR